MRTLVGQLSTYASYHRHPRNVVAHCVGIPMVVAAVAVLLSRPSAYLLGLPLCFGAWIAAQPTQVGLATGLGGFLVGWTLQWVGHYIGGRKPACVDDATVLAIGPLFVVVELLCWLAFRRRLRSAMEARARGDAQLFTGKDAQ
jgi:uncharacterized membrane protein YGL010W